MSNNVPEGGGFGAVLRRYRVAANLTQEELAERSGLSAQAIGSLERGVRRSPRPSTVEYLADALKLEAAQRATFVAFARGGAHHDQSSASEIFAGSTSDSGKTKLVLLLMAEVGKVSLSNLAHLFQAQGNLNDTVATRRVLEELAAEVDRPPLDG